MSLIIPKHYTPKLLPETTEQAIKGLKESFQRALAKNLNLRRVTAPLFVLSGTGINDDLNGVERAVRFPIKCMGDRQAEVVHSLAKWKRLKLGAYRIPAGYGLYTDMNAIRSDEDLDNLHSLYVDQWDWEKSINESDRNLDYLKDTVRKIYKALKDTEAELYEIHPHITPMLPDDIVFIHSEELLQMYPGLSPKAREYEAARKYGAIFIIGIGGKLSNGEPHDGRAPDYDDWSLNGDIILYYEPLDCAFEISSMGIRVDENSLRAQLAAEHCEDRLSLPFHRALLSGALPLTMGGGIGQSRLSMFMLKKLHIGEVQVSVWDKKNIEYCNKNNIQLM